MPNYQGNPQIAAYGRKTRFGDGACPHAARSRASPPWTARRIARAIAEFQPPNGCCVADITVGAILCHFKEKNEPVTVMHALIAILAVKALHNPGAMKRMIDLVDGPQR